MNITRKYLYSRVNKKLGFSKNISSQIVDDYFKLIILELEKNEKVKISSFGTFEVLNKKERIGRNPKNKKTYKISSQKSLSFITSKKFNDKIQDL